VLLRADVDDPRALGSLVRRARRMLDLDADPGAVATVLSRDPRLRPLVAARPGLRLIGSWDAWECVVRTVVGQQVSVRAAGTLLGRLVATVGSTGFPTAAELVDRDLTRVGLPPARAETLARIAGAVVAGELVLDGSAPAGEPLAALAALPGIGPWSVALVALRGLRDPDAWPTTDLVLRRSCLRLGIDPDQDGHGWRPWRGYAAAHLWEDAAHAAHAGRAGRED
jgi:AraC family transcriptional regulator of adaptative response / DNA-3-methyladenine glycosylase II